MNERKTETEELCEKASKRISTRQNVNNLTDWINLCISDKPKNMTYIWFFANIHDRKKQLTSKRDTVQNVNEMKSCRMNVD